jgi:hypothetical protein
MESTDANNPLDERTDAGGTDAGDTSAGAGADAQGDDWRLQVALALEQPHGALRELIGRVRGPDGPDVVKDVKAEVPHDVAITHDGQMLFAYAGSREGLEAARQAIEGVLARDQVGASITVSHWDSEVDRWRQVDPPPSAEEQRAQEAASIDDMAVETRTMVASTGNVVREEFEQTMIAGAQRLGLECKVVQHPHLLTTQLAFTVTGPRRKIDEFARELRSEGVAMLRTDEWLVASPL